MDVSRSTPGTAPGAPPGANPTQRTRRPGLGRRLAASALLPLGAIGATLALAGPAAAAVTVGESITAFPNRDMVVAVGYNAGEELTVEVVRNGTVIGTTTGPAVDTPEGVGLEVNHGPLGTPQPGDCWTNFTPDIIGGDIIRVTPADGRGVDTMTVRDVDFDGDPYLDGTNVSVNGTAAAGTDFIVEFRRDKPAPRFRRGPFTPTFTTPTTWKATFRVGTTNSAEGLTPDQQRTIALNEASWMAVATAGAETTIAEHGEPGGVGPGCNGSADPNTMVGGLDPINITSSDVTFSGTAREGVTAVNVTVGGLGARDATVTANAGSPSTWTLTVPKAELSTLPDGTVAVTPRFVSPTGTTTGTTRNVVKDTTAPLAPVASPPAGTYSGTQNVALTKPTGEGTSKVYWEIGPVGSAPDPDEFSNPYTSQIAVSATQAIKARVIDAAGNPGLVATFDYKIGTPPAAPTGVTATEGKGEARIAWSPVSGAVSYNVYRDGVKANNAAITGTTFTDSPVDGQHSYVVRAVETNGIESANSTPASVTVAPPGVPQGLSAAAGNAQVTLRWTAQTDAANFRVYRNGQALSPLVSGTATSYTNTGLTNGTLYDYEIAALDAAGNESAKSGVVQATPVAPAGDTTVPTVTDRSPVSGATGVAVGNNVTATFSENVQGVSGTTFILRAAGSTTNIAAAVSYSTTTRVATLNPSANLAAGTQYTATLIGGTTAIRDAANNPLAEPSWTFTTAPQAGAPTVTGRSPAVNATGVAVGNNVTATFSEAVQGVSGTTFFLRAAGSTTNIPATVSYNATSRVATLNPSANLTAGTQYTATLTGGTTAIRDSTNVALGTTSWSFTTAPSTGTGDTIAPTVSSQSPAVNATGVAAGNNVTATFSEAVQGVSGTTFFLRAAGSTTNIPATVSYNATTRVATLDPTASLAAGTQYTASLTGGATAIRDAANNPLASTSWTFTTATATTNPPPTDPPPSTTGIAFRASSIANNGNGTTTLQISRPAGTQTGDVALAAIVTRGAPAITAPTGWTLVREFANGTTMRQAVYRRAVTETEPASYTWTLASSQPAAGVISAYSGVNTTAPVNVDAGQSNASGVTSVTAPSITTTRANTQLVGFFGKAQSTAVTPPTGMTERGESASPSTAAFRVTIEVADETVGTTGATGTRAAATSATAASVGQLVALAP